MRLSTSSSSHEQACGCSSVSASLGTGARERPGRSSRRPVAGLGHGRGYEPSARIQGRWQSIVSSVPSSPVCPGMHSPLPLPSLPRLRVFQSCQEKLTQSWVDSRLEGLQVLEEQSWCAWEGLCGQGFEPEERPQMVRSDGERIHIVSCSGGCTFFGTVLSGFTDESAYATTLPHDTHPHRGP